MTLAHNRKHFLDWLRVLAFAFLILFHIGLLYGSWPYNLKSPRIYPEIEWALVSLNPWRLALLFFVSGVASRYLLIKMGSRSFIGDRLRRLVPVLLVGMLVTNPPQTYVELRANGLISAGYLEFWTQSYLTADLSYGIAMPRWDHLWFLLYLICYMLLFFGGLLIFRKYRYADENFHKAIIPYVVAPALWLAMTNMLVTEFRPATHALYNDWAAHLRWAGLFFLGVVCARHRMFWAALMRNRRILAVLSFVFLCAHLVIRDSVLAGALAPAAYDAGSGLFGGTALLALCAYGGQYLDRPSALLAYLNKAVLPIYVLHQPAMLVTAFFIFPERMPIGVEVLMLVIATLLIPLIVYEVAIRRIGALRFLFGLKPRDALLSNHRL